MDDKKTPQEELEMLAEKAGVNVDKLKSLVFKVYKTEKQIQEELNSMREANLKQLRNQREFLTLSIENSELQKRWADIQGAMPPQTKSGIITPNIGIVKA